MKIVGLLRGINVGGHGKLPMKSLIDICMTLGFQNPQHYIQSGNIVFDADNPPNPEQLSRAIEVQHGFAPKVMFITANEFIDIASKNPFAATVMPANHKFLQQCMFTEMPANVDLEKIKSRAIENERWLLRDNCFDLYSPAGVHNSKLARDIEKLLGVPTTARNWKTILKIWEMCRHETKGGDGVA